MTDTATLPPRLLSVRSVARELVGPPDLPPRMVSTGTLARIWGYPERNIVSLLRAGLAPSIRPTRRTWLMRSQDVRRLPLTPEMVEVLARPIPLAVPKVELLPLAREMLAAIRAHPRDGQYVYFIRCETFVKVGHSYSPLRRIAEMRPHTPHDLHLLKVVAGSVAAEQALHDLLAKFRHRAEWFRLEPDLADAIKQLPGNRVPKKYG